MATYYVRKTGSDSNAGTSAGAAWLTIGKALGASGIASGDTVYIGAGVYREAVTVNMTSATAETKVIGDVDGKQTGDAGEVVWTAHVTDDITAPVSSNTLAPNTRDYLTFQNIIFHSGTNACVSASAGSTNLTFYRCAFFTYAGKMGIEYAVSVDTNVALLIDSCEFWTAGAAASIAFSVPTSTVADYDFGATVKNCVIICTNLATRCSGSGANSFKGGGVIFYNCFIYANIGVSTVNANSSTTYPTKVYNSVITAVTCLSANASGQIVEDYNVLHAGTTARTNVTAGSNSKTNTYAAGWHGLRIPMQGLVPYRSAAEPYTSSPYLGFGAQAGGPSTDITGFTRPSGGASTSYAVGAYERGNCATQESSTVHAGTYAAKITGPGYQDFQVPVDASSTTISIYARYDTNHGTTNKPQISVLNGGGIGVSDATATMTSGVDTWEQLQLTFTPTAKGIVTIRCISRSAAGNGIAYFDS